MAIYKERRRLCYSPQQIFELVAQVERYPEFLPLWHYANIAREQQINSSHKVYVTDQVIQLGLVYKRFRTTTTLEANRHIHIVSSDPLFRKFSIDWYFSPIKESQDKKLAGKKGPSEKEGGSQIDFILNCEASSILLRPVFEVVLMDTARSIVSSFENRARSIYEH